jgi:hypothetical protein
VEPHNTGQNINAGQNKIAPLPLLLGSREKHMSKIDYDQTAMGLLLVTSAVILKVMLFW